MSDILVCDGSNLFVRAFFSMTDTVLQNSKCQDTTAIYTFLKHLRMIVEKEKPEEVYIIFDFGRDSRKKQIFSEYKANRNIDLSNLSGYDLTVKMNEIESRKRQKEVIINILKTLPIKLVIVKQIEGDSLIAQVANHFTSKDKTVTICSNDKDFYQLLSTDKIKIYNPHKKEYIDATNVHDIFPVKIPLDSYRLYKSIRGDVSDNINGIFRFGDKKIQQLFDMIEGEKPRTIEELFKSIENNETLKSKFGKYFTEETKSLLERNFKLIDLIDIDFSPQSLSTIYRAIESAPSFSKMDFMQILIRENINTILSQVEKFMIPFERMLPKNKA